MHPLAAADGLLGVSVADFNPDLDPVGDYARRVVDALAMLLTAVAVERLLLAMRGSFGRA